MTLHSLDLFKKFQNTKQLYNGLEEMEVDILLLEERKRLWSHFNIIVKDKDNFVILINHSEYDWNKPPHPAYRIKKKFDGKVSLFQIKERVFMNEIMKYGGIRNPFLLDMDYYLNFQCNTKIKIDKVEMLDYRQRKMDFELM